MGGCCEHREWCGEVCQGRERDAGGEEEDHELLVFTVTMCMIEATTIYN